MKFLGLRKLGACALFGAMLSGFFVTQDRAADDKVTLVKIDKTTGNPEVVAGRIRKESTEVISVEIRDPRTSAAIIRDFRPAEVASIEWGLDDSSYAAEWRSGMRSFDSGKYDKAAQDFKTIIDDKDAMDKFRTEAKPYLFYLHAESLFRAQKTAEAITALDEFIKNCRTSTYASLAMGSLVDACIQTGKFDQAQSLLNDMNRLGGEQAALAKYYNGKLLRAKKQPAEAAKKFAEAAVASSVPSTHGMALMGEAACAVDQNNPALAREKAQQALASNPPSSVAAAAHLVIGDALLSEIEAQKPVGDALKNKLVDAVLEYMRIVAQYPGDRNTEPKAYYKAGETLLTLAKKFPQERGFDAQRAVVLFSKLRDEPRFQGTEWVAKATQALSRIR